MLKTKTKEDGAGGVTLYGTDTEPETMVYLKPHEWLTVRANDWIRVSTARLGLTDDDLSKIDAVNARCEVESGWFSPETGQLEFTNRVKDVEGSDVAIHITDARR